jgi:2,4-dienoyl-CoA reductase-like NADH-dependent reductase (Old Yellow Enzyme family)
VKNCVPGIFVTTRLGVYDPLPYPYGFGVSKEDRMAPDLKESLDLVRELKTIGIPLLNHSIGNPHIEPHFGRPFDAPVKDAPIPDEHPLVGVARFLSITAEVQKAEPGLPVIGSGYSWLRRFWPYTAAASIARGRAAAVGLGRSAFAYPDAFRDLAENGNLDPNKTCTACSACSTLLRSGGPAGCPVRDGEVYALQ